MQSSPPTVPKLLQNLQTLRLSTAKTQHQLIQVAPPPFPIPGGGDEQSVLILTGRYGRTKRGRESPPTTTSTTTGRASVERRLFASESLKCQIQPERAAARVNGPETWRNKSCWVLFFSFKWGKSNIRKQDPRTETTAADNGASFSSLVFV